MARLIHEDAYGCRNSGMPLGGIGAGSVEIRPDGYFYRWLLMNNRPWGTAPATDAMERGGLRFGLQYDCGTETRSLLLGLHHGLDPVSDGWFWFSDPYRQAWVEHARRIGYRARFPVATLDYQYDELPLGIELTAWSPFIPHQTQDSNTPAGVFSFRLTNHGHKSCRAALFGVLKNAVGYDHPELVSRIRWETGGLVFGREGLAEDAPTQGTMALFAEASRKTVVSWLMHPRHGRDFFDPLRKAGRLENEDFGKPVDGIGDVGAEQKAGPKGMQRGALCLGVTLKPGTAVDVTFVLAWHFPNFRETDCRNTPGKIISTQYANRFADAPAVARWVLANRSRLVTETRRFADSFSASSLPAWELDAVAAGLSILHRAAWWDRAGRFGIWEGVGCCGLQTIDVGHYASQATLQLFPDLEASQNRLSAANCESTGKVPHLMPGNFDCCDATHDRGRIDLGAQFTLAVWRRARWAGDLALAREMWPVIQVNLKLLESFDTDGDGLPNNLGPDQTYDRFPMIGTTALCGILYLAALEAAADLGDWLSEPTHYRQQAAQARPALLKQLWNGDYFNLSHDAAKNETNTGCLTDQVNGDWFYRLATGQPLLDDTLVRRALSSVVAINRRTGGRLAWLANCTWPRGGGIEITRSGSDQANCPWSGVEYAVASHALMMGLGKVGRQIALDVFHRYEDAGLRHDHVECGEFYYRALSVWAVYQAEFGIVYYGLRKRLELSPPKRDCRFVVVLPTGYAQAQWRERTRQLTVTRLGGSWPVREMFVRGKSVATRIS